LQIQISFTLNKIIMGTIVRNGDNFLLTIPKNLLSDNLIQRLLRLIEFQEVVKNNQMTEADADLLSEEIKEKWWNDNKEWLLKDLKL
jgi:hypothetical protein